VFFVRGQNSDPKTVQLNAVDLDSGNRKELARLTAPFAVDVVYVTYADDRIFVATAGADGPARKAAVRITCFSATSGKRLWEIPHDFTAVNFQDVLVPVGAFYTMKDFLVYAIGRDLFVIRAEDGTIHAQHRDNAFIVTNSPPAAADDVTYFGTVANELVAYNVATKQVVLRTSIPDFEQQRLCVCSVSGGILFREDRTSVFAYDVSPGAASADRLKWRLKATQGQRFRWAFKFKDYVWALRDDNVLLRLDPSTGKLLNEYSLLWTPVDFSLDGDRLYAFTADGQAYAMQLK
jgi:outer membrane protein assembly factor BamB